MGLQHGDASEPQGAEAAVGKMPGMLTKNALILGIVTTLEKNLNGETKKQHWESPTTVGAWEKKWKAENLGWADPNLSLWGSSPMMQRLCAAHP